MWDDSPHLSPPPLSCRTFSTDFLPREDEDNTLRSAAEPTRTQARRRRKVAKATTTTELKLFCWLPVAKRGLRVGKGVGSRQWFWGGDTSHSVKGKGLELGGGSTTTAKGEKVTDGTEKLPEEKIRLMSKTSMNKV